MSSTVEKLSSNKVKLTFTVDAAQFEEGIKKAYAKEGKRFNIPGFRRGKAPLKVIENFYGKGVFYENALEEIFPGVYSEALKEHSVNAVDRPELDVQQMEAGKELQFTVEVFVKPDVTMGDYKAVRVIKTVDEVTDDDVSAELARAQERVARFIDVTDRPVKFDDQVNIDYAGFDGDNQFEGGTAQGHDLVIGSGSFIPGFEEQLIGKSIGEETDVNVTFPEEYHSKELAGKPVVFKVKINGIQEKETPELNDDFAKDVSECDTLNEYKKSIRDKLTDEAEKRAETAFENEVIDKITELMEADIPNAMIEESIDSMLQDMRLRFSYQGLKLEDYCKYTGQTMEQLRGMYKEPAEKRVRTQLMLEYVRDAEGIKATDEEVERDIDEYAADSGAKDPAEFKAGLGEGEKQYFAEKATMQKVVDYLKDLAKQA